MFCYFFCCIVTFSLFCWVVGCFVFGGLVLLVLVLVGTVTVDSFVDFKVGFFFFFVVVSFPVSRNEGCRVPKENRRERRQKKKTRLGVSS